MRGLKLLLAMCLIGGAVPSAAWAAKAKPEAQKTVATDKPEIIQDSKHIVQTAEQYLQGLSSATARFVQTTHDGTQLVGTFYLQRPGKLRFEYDPPIKDFVVADGLFIYFYDAELGEQTNAPIGQTLADFFLRKNLKLSGDVSVEEVKRAGGFLQIKLLQTNDPEAGSLTLAFKEDSQDPEKLTLAKWRVVDGQGLITEVELFHLKTGMKHAGKLFAYVDPDKGKQKFNQ